MSKETLYTISFRRAPGLLRRTLLFCCFLLGLFLSATPRSLAQITGPNTICSGVSTLFNLTGTPDPAYTYNWTVTPPADATILTATNTSGTIQWVTTATTTSTITVTIIRPSMPNLVWNKTVTVLPAPNPQITTNTIVGCQGVIGDRKEDDPKAGAVAPNVKGTIIDDGVCLKVCSQSVVEYSVAGGQPGSTFEWTLDPSKGSFNGSSTGPVVSVNWSNNLGFTFIKVKETTAAGCVKEKSICIQIIESPQTLFSVNGDITPYNGNQCFEACVKGEIQFTDLTPPSLTSPLVAWQWDFGDGTFSSIQHPLHIYNSAGNYTVILKVTNQCGCVKEYKVCIEVNDPDKVPAKIQCPSIVCENAIGHYTIENDCPDMFWVVNGGTIQNATMNSVDILWNNVGPDGFGEIIADFSNCGGKCGPKVTAQVPVISANGTIIGKNPACYGKQYKYQLPKWPATNFKWSITSGSATIVGYDQNSYEVNVVAYGNYTLHCEYTNTLILCGGKADLNVTVVYPLALTAPAKVCNGTATSIVTTTPSAPGTTYTFIDPNGNTSYSGVFNVTGVWTVQATNPGFCDVDPISIQVVDAPAPLSSISGDIKACLNTPYVYEAIAPMPNTICNWSISGGSPATTTGNNATISWSSLPGSITVTRSWADLPGCSSSPTTLPVGPIVPTLSITGPVGSMTPCANTSVTYTGTPTSGPIDDIAWSITPSTAGSVSAGQNTMTPTITWNNTATNISCTLTAAITKCGSTTPVNQSITVIGTPTISLVASNTTPCSGVPVTFTATTTPAGANITWSTTGSPSSAGPGPSTAFTTTFTNLGAGIQNASVTAVVSMAGCPLTGQAINTVAVKPQPNINMSPGSGVSSTILTCNPVNIPLVLSTNTTYSILWYQNSIGIPGTSGTTAYTATSAGTYRVDVMNSFTCTSSITRVIAIDPSCGAPGCTLPAAAGVGSKNHSITTCANSAGQALVNVNFNSIYGTYLGSGSGTNILSLSVSGNSTYCTLPAISFGSFPNLPISGVQITKPGIYPVTLTIGYETSPGVPCYKFVTENIIVPVITDFDYTVNCIPGGYTLNLNEQSPILSTYSFGTSPLPAWTINGTAVSPTGINLSAYTPGSTITIVHNVRVSGPAGTFDCSRTKLYTVPTPLNPAFTISTTDPLGPNNSSCAWREVLFSSTNNTGVVKWNWNFGDSPTNTTFIGTIPTATRTYDNPTATYNPNVTLTLTDAYGCTASVTNQFNLKRNTILAGPYSLPEEIKCVGSASSITLTGVSSSYPGYSFAWYKEDIALGLSSNPISVTQNGLYWARVTDARGCQKAANPIPAKRAFQPLPDVAIFGAHEYCPQQPITLNAINGSTTGFTYQWQQFTGSWVNIGGATSGIFTLPSGLAAGNYQYRVIVSQALPSPYTAAGPCPAISPAFNIIVHPIPNYPYISGPYPINCDDYSLQLNISSPQPGEVYNWSNGTAGNSTVINHGGPYRVWATNQWGCKNQADIDIPLEPSAYFWRFPHGCYTFCPEQLPRRIDGPSYVPFASWEWMINNSSLPFPNGPWASAGSGVVQPLNINTDPSMGGDGNGSGDYKWMLDNGLCKQISDPMSIDIMDKCCRMDSKLAYFNCIWPKGATSPTYYAGIYVFGGFDDCKYASYTVYAVDPVTGLPNGTVTPASGAYTPGSLINFAYSPFPGVTNVQFKVVVNCDGRECIADIKIDRNLKDYPCKDMIECDLGRKIEYIRCVWPKGATSPTYLAGIAIGNPYGCSATSYSITAVDPVTGLPNGSISPSTGTIPPGWSSIGFSYTPNPGVTSVKVIITLICDGKVCSTVLGVFEGLDDKEKYPCTDYIGKTKSKETTIAIDGITRMSIAPNPANDNVSISYDIANWKEGDLYQIAIVNLLGQSVAQYTVTGSKGAWQHATLQMSSGTYLVRLVKNGRNIDVQHMLIVH